MEDPRMNPHLLLDPIMYPPFPPLPQARDRRTGGAFIPRKKIKIRWLEDDARRRETLKKRRSGIIKKAEELHILCDVQTCVIIFNPNEDQPEVFPSVENAVEICRRFKELPEFNRANLMRSNVQFIQEMVDKKSKKLWTKNDDLTEMETLFHVYGGLIGMDMGSHDTEVLVRVQNKVQALLNERYNHWSTLHSEASTAPPPLALQEQPRINPLGMSTEDPRMDDLVARFLYGDESPPR